MSAPARIQLSRAKGFRLQERARALNGLAAVKVDRSTEWGNPWRIGEPVDMKLARRWGWKLAKPEYVCADAAEAVRRFSLALAFDDASKAAIIKRLRGRNAACWCGLCPAHAAGKPLGVTCADCAPCHADTLLELANS